MRRIATGIADLARARFARLAPPRHAVSVVFALHFNQNFAPYLDLVCLGFYSRLVAALRRRPGFPIGLHVSGNALTGMLWFHPPTVEMIRRGVEEGQFETLVSTYAQAIPEAVSEDEFRLQLDLHRETLDEVFGAAPRPVFWNPERIWTPALFDRLVDEGVERTFIEDRVLEDALGTRQARGAVALEKGGRRLVCLPDSNEFRSVFNDYLNGGPFFRVEALVARRAAAGGGCLVYAEDAEAIGLWAFEKDPAADIDAIFERFGRAVDWFAACPHARIVPPSAVPPAGPPVAPGSLVRREPLWIERALAFSDERFHEPGYRDWFDFNERSERLRAYRARSRRVLREIQDTLASRLRAGSVVAPRAATRFVNLARHLFAHHQYEFGCPGLMSGRDVHLNRILASLVPIRLLAECRGREWRTLLTDIDDDGRDEAVVIHHDFLMVIDRRGRMKALFNLRRGIELTGGLLPGTLTERDDGPNDISRDLRYRDDLWPWLGQRDLGALGAKTYRMRRLKFTDTASVDGGPPEPFPFAFADRMTSVYLARFRGEMGDLEGNKEYDCAKDSVHLRYRFANVGRAPHSFHLVVDAPLCPDYLSVIRRGRRALHFYTETGLLDPEAPLSLTKEGIGVRNEASGVGLRLRFVREEPALVEPYEALHALGLRIEYRFDLAPREERFFSIHAVLEDL